MTDFSPTVTRFWFGPWEGAGILHERDELLVVVDPGLTEDRRLSLLAPLGGRAVARLTPEVADRIDLRGTSSAADFRRAVSDAGITLNDADQIFYFTDDAAKAVRVEARSPRVRPLTDDDAEVFAVFQSSASEDDLDAAWVELDHWLVVGSFEGDRLVSAASAYPWAGSRVADVGILTLPDFRGTGRARAVVRAICAEVFERGHEPQYRSQRENLGSTATALSAGLRLFGTWEVVSPDPEG